MKSSLLKELSFNIYIYNFYIYLKLCYSAFAFEVFSRHFG